MPLQSHPLMQTEQAATAVARSREAILAKTDRPRVYFQSSLFARGSGANPDGQFDAGGDGLGLERANWVAGVQVVFPNLFDFASLRARRAAASALTRARYDAGLASTVEVAEAQNLLAAAEYRDAVARVDLWRALLTRAAAQGRMASFIELLHPPGMP